MKKLTYEFVKGEFEKEGYELLSTKYVNAHTKLDYICPKGHMHSIKWSGWYVGHRCRYCYGNPILTVGKIRKHFENEGYKLISDSFGTAHTKLEYICPKGHNYTITWNNWQQGKRCFYCAVESRAAKRRIDFNLIKNEFRSEGYILLAKSYKHCDQRLDFICPNGHRHSISWNDWKYNGSRCAICANIRNSGPGNCNWKGGISCEPYCDIWLDKDFKESIKERDDYKCQNHHCFKKGGNAAQLTIHHIDYNKKNCHPSNLITLCKSCNGRANKDREWHKDFYNSLIKKKYSYKEV